MSYFLVNTLNSVLNEENRRSFEDANLASLMTNWEVQVNDYYTDLLNYDYTNYTTATSTGQPSNGKTADEWSKQYDLDQTTMQTEVQETDSLVKTTTGQVTQNQTYIQNVVTAMSYASQLMQYLSGTIKTKL